MNDKQLNDLAWNKMRDAENRGGSLLGLFDLAMSVTASLLSIAKNLTWITENPHAFGKDR